MLTFGFCSASYSDCRLSQSLPNTPQQLSSPPFMTHRYSGCADLRLAVVSPFVDRRHGTERALAEVLERLAHKEHCESHLYAQRVQDLLAAKQRGARSQDSGVIIW